MRVALHGLILALFFCATTAITCDIRNLTIGKDPIRDYVLLISNQTELDAVADLGCDTLIGSIAINVTYVGPIVVRGVKNLTGSFYFDGHGYITPSTTKNVTSIEFSDLEFMDYLDIQSPETSSIRSISLPKATSINRVGLFGLAGMAISFPSLTRADTLYVAGNVTSMDFSQLQVVDTVINICSSADCEFIFDLYSKVISWPPIEVNFPLLSNASELALMGNFSSISMPYLEIARGDGMFGVYIVAWGNPIPISFPKLSISNSTVIGGFFTNISFPSLHDIPQSLSITTREHIPINLPNITTAAQITIEGNVTSVSLPALQKVSDLEIWSDATISCKSLKNQMSSIEGYWNISATPKFNCQGYIKKEIHISAGAGIGIALGSLAGALILYALIKEFFVSRKLKREKLKRGVEGEGQGVEMGGMDQSVHGPRGDGEEDGDVLPAYEGGVDDRPPPFEPVPRVGH